MDFWKSIKVFKRRRWTIILVTLVGLGAFLAIPSTLEAPPPIYVSQAIILLTPPTGTVSAYGGSQAQGGVSLADSWFADQVVLDELISSEELLTRVLTKMQSSMPWWELTEHIRVNHLSSDKKITRLFELIVDSTDPKESQKLARVITEEFQAYVQEISAREFANTRRFIEELVVEAEERRQEADEALQQVREKYAGTLPDDALQMEQQSLEQVRQQAQREATDLQAEIAAIKSYLDGQTPNPPWSILENRDGSLGALEANVANLRFEIEKLRTVYTDDNEKVVTAKQQLAKAEDLYKANLDSYVTSLYNDKSSQLQQKLNQNRLATTQLNEILRSRMTPDDRRIVTKFEREIALWEENHLNLLQQLYQARVVEQSSRRQGSVTVLEKPRVGEIDEGSVGLSSALRLAMAIPLCLAFGIGAAFLREQLAVSLKLRPRVEEVLEIPVIAVIPSCRDPLVLEWETYKRPSITSPRDQNGSSSSEKTISLRS